MTTRKMCRGVKVTTKSGCVHCGVCGQYIRGGNLTYDHDLFTCTSIDAESPAPVEGAK